MCPRVFGLVQGFPDLFGPIGEGFAHVQKMRHLKWTIQVLATQDINK